VTACDPAGIEQCAVDLELAAQQCDLVLCGFEFGARDIFLFEQFALAFEIAFGVFEVGAIFRDQSLAAAETGVLGARIEREQPLALAHELAFPDVDCLDRRADLRPYFDHLHCRDHTVRDQSDRHVGSRHRGADDRHGCRAFWFGSGTAAIP